MKRRYLAAALVVAALACGLYTLFLAQEAIRAGAHAWEGGRAENGAYTLETFRRDEAGIAGATFRVLDTESGAVLYTCPGVWRTMDLKGISWAAEGYDIQVVSGDVGTVTYFHGDGAWTTVPPQPPTPIPLPEPSPEPMPAPSDEAGGDHILPETVLLDPETELSMLPEGNLTEYARLCAEGWVFELVETDVWDGDSLWGGWLCRVLVSQEGPEGFVFRQALDVKNRPNADADRSLIFTDVDFDGRPDLLVWQGHFGAQGATQYACFLQREDGFVENVSFSGIANPAVDPERREILSSWRNWAASHGWGVYEYRGGEFVRTRVLTEAPVEGSTNGGEDELVWQWSVMEALPDGQWETTAVWRSDELTEAEIADLIYNENSEWGIMTDRWRILFNSGLMADFSIYND